MHTKKHLITLACLLTQISCTSVQPQRGFDDVQQDIAARIQQQVHWKNGGPEDQQVAEKVRALLQQPLTVEGAVQVALLTSPKLQATYENLGIAQATLVQAGLIQNPVFDIVARYPRGGGQRNVDIDISHDFLSLLTLAMHKSISESDFEATRLRVTGVVIDHALSVRQAFYQMQMAEQFKEMMAHVVLSTAAALKAAQKLHAIGNMSAYAHDQYRNMHEETLLMLADAEEMALMSREKINQLLGLWGSATAWTVANRLPVLPDGLVDLSHIEQKAIARSLDLAIKRHEMAVLAKQLGLTERTRFLPDLELGYAWERGDGEWEDGPSLSVQIPIFDYGQAQHAKRQAQMAQLQRAYVDLAINLRSEARMAAIRVRQAYAKAKHFERVLLPLRQRLVNGAQLEYNAMQIGVFKLLMARKKQIATGQQYMLRLKTYWMAKATLDQLLSGKMVATTNQGGMMTMANDDNAGEH